MRNRWFHPPQLHTPSDTVEKKATWLELFYDLIFVAAFIQLGNGLSEHVSLGGFLAFGAIFIPLWTVWTSFTHYVNRFTIDDFAHRVLVFIQMFAVGVMAVSAPDVLDGQPQLFSLSCGVAQAAICVLYARSYAQEKRARAPSAYWGSVLGLSAAMWLGSAFVAAPWCYVMWGLGMALTFAAPFSRQSRALRQEFPNDEEHLSERFGLMTIIVLGESFVKVLSSLSGHVDGKAFVIMQASLTLLITCCLWWIYFDDVAGSRLKKKPLAQLIWLYAHLPLQLAITSSGVAVKKAVHFDFSAVAPEKYRWLLCGTLALALFSVAVIDSVTERRQAELSDRARVNVRFGSAALALVLAPAGAGMNAGLFLTFITLLCVAQVFFDMMMAPLEAESKHAPALPSVGDLVRSNASIPKLRRRFGPEDAVRKGTPSELRRDLYFFLMDGSWTRLFTVAAFLYGAVNVFFGALYMLEPGCIDGALPRSFGDAFFFSVQTFSTIGYGVMSPATSYADAVVTIEAAVGLLGAALTTGIIFAKASRPSASVLFSKSIVITRRHGEPTLMLRAGNARGNEVVDASITLTALLDEVTPEGDHLRRLHDLKLVRERSPLFMMTWSIMHVIDAESPLANVDWQDANTFPYALIASLIGHDGTYGQTIHARHNYQPEDIVPGHRFVDVIRQLPDGRMLVDYDHFHDTVAETPLAGAGSADN